MAIQTLGRAEPVQLAAGQNGNFSMPFNIAALSIDNFGEYFVFVQPSNRPGFWISPYEVKSIVNLSPPAQSVSITQTIAGPNGVSGAVSSGGVGTVNITLWDSFQSNQAGIISSPPAQYITLVGLAFDDGATHTFLTAPAGFNIIIKQLSISQRMSEFIGGGILLLSAMEIVWSSSGTDPNRFKWYQSISPESPNWADSFVDGAAIILSGLSLTWQAAFDLLSYYTLGSPTVQIVVVYYLVHQ